MAKIMNMMKQVRQVKKMQKKLAAKSVEAKSPDGMVVVVARGDMTIKSITLDPEKISMDRLVKLQKVLASTVNSALDSAKRATASDMQKMTSSLGDLSGLLGG